MVNIRKVLLTTGEIYHIFNRGVERRNIFSDKREFKKALDILNYYRYANIPVRFSYFNPPTRKSEGYQPLDG